MVTDAQVRRLMSLIPKEETLAVAAAKAGMDEKTARKYRRSGHLPSGMKTDHTWRTRPDPFADTWPEVRSHLEVNPALEAKTLFAHLHTEVSGTISGRPVAHAAAQGQDLACSGRSCPRGVLPAGSPAGMPLPVRLHGDDVAWGDDLRPAVRSSSLEQTELLYTEMQPANAHKAGGARSVGTVVKGRRKSSVGIG